MGLGRPMSGHGIVHVSTILLPLKPNNLTVARSDAHILEMAMTSPYLPRLTLPGQVQKVQVRVCFSAFCFAV